MKLCDTMNIESVELEDEYFHVRFNDPERFEAIRTPDWAANVATSVSEGAEVRMGNEKEGDDWEVQSVLIEKSEGEEKAREQAQRIVEKLND